MASKMSRLLVSFLVAFVIVTSTFVAYQLDLYSRWRPHRWRPGFGPPGPPHYPGSSLDDLAFSVPAKLFSLQDIVQALWRPLVIPITADSFVDYNGTMQTRGDLEPRWGAPLGKKLCIVDIDTRPMSDKHQILDPGSVAWSELDIAGSGMLNHYLYALIHGYTYHFIHTPPLKDKAPFWTKIPALASTLSSSHCDITVSIDADASFMNLALPFEWLLNRWNITASTSLGLAFDPEAEYNNDAARNNTNLNAGFIVAQNNPRTHEILRAWSACPDNEIKYPNCSRWKIEWPAEQAAFSEYTRYEFTRDEDIKAIECGDSNGYPESGTECHGTFIQHHWIRKDLVRPAVVETVMAGIMGRVRREFVDEGVVVEVVEGGSGEVRERRSGEAEVEK